MLTPETGQAVVLEEGGHSRTVDKTRASVSRNPGHTPAQPPAQPPHTLEEVEKTAGGKGEGGLNLFCRTLAETICADDMDAMLWSALSLETWSWGTVIT